MRRSSLGRASLLSFACVGAALGACSSKDHGPGSGPTPPGSKPDASTPHPSTGGLPGGFFPADAGFLDIEGGSRAVVISPGGTTELTVTPGEPLPSAQFTVSSRPSRSTLRVTNPGLGAIDQRGLFTASGLMGGEAQIQVVEGGRVLASVTIVVNIVREQNGGVPNAADAGAGGLGGVGGEGFGEAVSVAIKKVLEGSAQADAALKLLYPYDETVFPLGILPPLVQWSSGAPADVDGVLIHLSAAHYDYKGYFSRPSTLSSNKPFERHPIPREVWDGATRTAAGGRLSLEVSLSSKGQAVGPVAQHYEIALAPFRGVIYYQAYGTALVENYDTSFGRRIGGATLSIRAGEEGPRLVAGTTTNDHSGCRVCHSVSARGDVMVVQHGDQYLDSSRYDLNDGNAETTPYKPGSVGWIGLTPDGKLGLANSITLNGGPVSNTGDTRLYDMETGGVVEAPGLNEFVSTTVLPSFSHDGKRVAFGLRSGPSTPEIGEARRQLVAMDFDLPTRTFSNPIALWDPADGKVAFSTFTPDGNHVVVAKRWNGNDDYSTTHDARSELWWVDLATRTPTRLDRANGVGEGGTAYIPRGPNYHDRDETLNYEPSISPVAAGGYAWVVFMSRRMYGNVATRNPYESHAIEQDLSRDPTPKKIWMAAIDLDAKPGADPSHPAFYIPGQELYGVNSRPFFVMDPCVTDRGTCSTGIDCCGGFCRDGLCQPPAVDEVCSRIDERCDTEADCCDDRARCIGGFCALTVR